MFHFKGYILLSKSWLNRFQIINSYSSINQERGLSYDKSQDVIDLEQALVDVKQGLTVFDLGQGGTSFRFFSFLVSRGSGSFKLKAHPRLLARPQSELNKILQQLSVHFEIKNDCAFIKSEGWSWSSPIRISKNVSSQFASGLLLNAWRLPEKMIIMIEKPISSYNYLKMTLEMLRISGLKFEQSENENFIHLSVDADQTPKSLDLVAPELDISSAFSIVACAVVDGDVEITNWSSGSTQPDLIFLDLFKKMGIMYEEGPTNLKIQKQDQWSAIQVDLRNSPDLFPVLAALVAEAQGISVLEGAQQLKDKESNRIHKTYELLQLCGYKCKKKNDGLVIYGKSSSADKQRAIYFNPDHDHRMAMAAAIFRLYGYNIKIETPEVVNKSYPNFWQDTQLRPL